MAIVLLGGSALLLLGGVSPLGPVLVAAGTAQALTLTLGRRVGERGRYVPGLLLFIGAYAVAEGREGRGVPSPLLILALVILALVRLRLSLVGGTDEDDSGRRSWKSAGPWLARLALPLLLTLLGLYSAGAGGAEEMAPWFSWLPSDISWTTVIAVRKAIHATFYPLLALSALVALDRIRPDLRANVPWALAFTAIFAIFDEVRQSTIPARTGSAWDVLLDLTATAIVLALVLFLRRTKLKA